MFLTPQSMTIDDEILHEIAKLEELAFFVDALRLRSMSRRLARPTLPTPMLESGLRALAATG